jgi:hypothetical protein
MKKLIMTMSLLVVAAVAFSTVYAVATAEPVNKACPVAKKPIKAGAPTSDVKKGEKSYTVGFCCDGCKGKFDAESDPLKKFPVAEIK